MSRGWTRTAASCGTPEWKPTKRGRRCVAVCANGRWQFRKHEECEGGMASEGAAKEAVAAKRGQAAAEREVEEFSGPIEPLALVPLVPMPLWEPEGEKKQRKGRRGGARRNKRG